MVINHRVGTLLLQDTATITGGPITRGTDLVDRDKTHGAVDAMTIVGTANPMYNIPTNHPWGTMVAITL